MPYYFDGYYVSSISEQTDNRKGRKRTTNRNLFRVWPPGIEITLVPMRAYSLEPNVTTRKERNGAGSVVRGGDYRSITQHVNLKSTCGHECRTSDKRSVLQQTGDVQVGFAQQ